MFSSELKSEAHFLPRVATKRKLTQPLHFLKTPVFSKWLVKKNWVPEQKTSLFWAFPKDCSLGKPRNYLLENPKRPVFWGLKSQKTSLLGLDYL
jgi:hypothetical protein